MHVFWNSENGRMLRRLWPARPPLWLRLVSDTEQDCHLVFTSLLSCRGRCCPNRISELTSCKCWLVEAVTFL